MTIFLRNTLQIKTEKYNLVSDLKKMTHITMLCLTLEYIGTLETINALYFAGNKISHKCKQKLRQKFWNLPKFNIILLFAYLITV